MITQLYDLLGPHYPFGQGLSSSTISSDPCARAGCSGTSGSTSLTVTEKSGTFTDGDIVIIHQTRGSDVDNWEVNQISSGGSTGTFTLVNQLGRTYTSQTGTSSAERAQVLTVPQYLNLTMNSFTPVGWRTTESYNNYGWGGITAVAVRGTLNISGTPNFSGIDGYVTTQDHSVSSIPSWYTARIQGGFRQGWNSNDGSAAGAGEGHTGSFEIETNTAQGSGGGGGLASGSTPGGGGGNGTSGVGVGGNGGQGGSATGNDSLTRIWPGGAGGGGRGVDGSRAAASGGNGGGVFIIWANVINVTGGLRALGGNGADGDTANNADCDGGGGAGGSILINCNLGTFGSNLVLAYGGSGGPKAGAGGTGRIRINYASLITGSTNPVASTNIDRKLRVPSGMLQVIG